MNSSDVPVDPRRLDPRLRGLLRLPLDMLRQMKSEEIKSHQQHLRDIDELRAQARSADAERRRRLTAEIERRLLDIPAPSTFGVYFPDDDPEEVRRVTHLREPFISATIRSDASTSDLAALGMHVRNRAGSIFTAYVPVALLQRLQASTSIEYVELARPWRPQLDDSIPQTQIDTLHDGNPAVTGRGVIVGIVEVGPLDFYHPAFRDPGTTTGEGGLGSSRILFLWDQTLVPDPTRGESGPPTETTVPPLPGFMPVGGPGGSGTYGTEYGQTDIDSDLQAFPPAYTVVRSAPGLSSFHGTLVSACAAGSERTGFPFGGAAPQADIIYVRTTNGNNYVFADSTNILDGIAYIFARAAETKKPCVVNLSASDSLGGHDGSTLGEQFLDNLLLEPDRVIVCSGGNDNLSNAYTHGTVAQGATTTVVVNYKSYQWDDTIQIWYDGHDEFELTLTIPTNPPTIVGPIAPGSPSLSTPIGLITVIVDSLSKTIVNGDNLIDIRITGAGGNPIPDGEWKLELHGTAVINGAFDAWVDTSFPPTFHAWKSPVAGTGTIGVPATALRPISVGAHDAAAPPGILAFSGCGPSRDGRVKPELTAPGFDIVGAMLRDMSLSDPGPLETPFPVSGTSYAAPIVAGAAALLFECRGSGLTCADIKQILVNLAGSPPVVTPSPSFGFGFLQMATGCTGTAAAVDVWLRDSPVDTGIEPFTGAVSWLSPDIDVLDAAGAPVANPTHDPLNLWNNLIDVTVRNRGTQAARNIEVFLYWADPATNLPFPSEWRAGGIFTGPALLQQGNKVVVGQLGSGSQTTVRFAWAPPPPSSNIRGDDHFCLIARIEHEADPSNVGAGGWPVISGSNNIALRNVHVQSAAGDASAGFFVVGSNDQDALELTVEKLAGRVEMLLPTRALPWHEMVMLERWHGLRTPYGSRRDFDSVDDVRRTLEGEEVSRILGVNGVYEARVAGAVAQLLAREGVARIVLPEIRIERGAKMPVRIWVRQPQLTGDSGWLHVGQRSGGRLVGGVSVEVRAYVREPARFDVRRRGDEVEVTPRRGSDGPSSSVGR
jgi:hypothetical protein